jgi:hypothetical protein
VPDDERVTLPSARLRIVVWADREDPGRRLVVVEFEAFPPMNRWGWKVNLYYDPAKSRSPRRKLRNNDEESFRACA